LFLKGQSHRGLLPGDYQEHPKAKVESHILISSLAVRCLPIHSHPLHEHQHPATKKKKKEN
jgi:hypothetical protein